MLRDPAAPVVRIIVKKITRYDSQQYHLDLEDTVVFPSWTVLISDNFLHVSAA